MGLATLLAGQAIDVSGPRHIAVTADGGEAAWNTVATHTLFVVTGAVRARILCVCTETVTSAGAGTMQLGVTGATNAIIAATDPTLIAIGEVWDDATPTTVFEPFATALLDWVTNGIDIGYEVVGNALTDGLLVFHCWWEPLDTTGVVTAGAGGPLA